jgi:hypothetical protein
MIVPRGQLAAEKVVDDDGALQVNADGSSIATNRRVFLCTEGLAVERQKGVPLRGGPLGGPSVVMTGETARELARAVPRDRKFGGLLEHLDLYSENSEDFRAEMSDGKRSRSVKARALPAKIDSRPVLRRILRTMAEGKVVCLNRRRLLRLLDALERVAEDSTGASRVWIGFGEDGDVALRCVNWATGLRSLAWMRSYSGEDTKQPEASEWERAVYAKPRPKPRPRKHKPRRRTA